MRWLVAFATVLTIGGILFGYYVVLPAALKFLTNYDDNLYNIQIRAKDYYSFVALVLLAVGVVFQVPLFILGLVRIGVLTSRKLRKNWRIGIVSMTALAVALPGVDPVTTLLEMVPLISLYLVSLALSGFFERRWRPEPPPPRSNDRALRRLGAAGRRAADRGRPRALRGRRDRRGRRRAGRSATSQTR